MILPSKMLSSLLLFSIAELLYKKDLEQLFIIEKKIFSRNFIFLVLIFCPEPFSIEILCVNIEINNIFKFI